MHQYPYLRILVSFIAGILVALYCEMPLPIIKWLIISFAILYSLLIFAFFNPLNYQYRWISGIVILMLFALIGYELTILNTPQFDKDNISQINSKNNVIIAQLSEPITERQKTFKIVAKVLKINDSSDWKKVNGQVLLYFEKDSTAKNLEYGDRIIAECMLNNVKPPQNPGEFNYRRYLSNKGIYKQAYIRSGNFKILGKKSGNFLFAIGYSIRNKFLEILKNNKLKGDEFAVVSAILLGYDDHLDAEQMKAFSGAGAMHILCVSGLHVGIIYVILNGLLLFMDRKKYLRIIKVFLLLVLIWTYALITGLSPSVLRACTMFSFIIAGQLIQRKINIYNSLAASAFFLLIINPYIITEVGFQLSYFAVVGIVTLFRPVYILFTSRLWLIDKIWQITVVSCAATIATAPLSIYYFNQFPNLFFVTNLVAIPASMLIIYAGILVLVTSFIPMVSTLFSYILIYIVRFLNHSVHIIESLSFATTRGIYINSIEMILIVGITILLVITLLQKRRKAVPLLLIMLVFLFVSFLFRQIVQVHQQKIIVYNISNSSAINFIYGKSGVILMDSNLRQDENRIAYHMVGCRTQLGLKDQIDFDLNTEKLDYGSLFKHDSYLQFLNKKVLLVNPATKLHPCGKILKVDYVVISGSPMLRMETLSKTVEFEKLIFDSSNTWWKVDRWVLDCEELELPYYRVGKEGAWVLDL